MALTPGAPKPRDPRQVAVTPEDVDKRINALLSRPVDSLAEEVAQLNAVHDVLHAALQKN